MKHYLTEDFYKKLLKKTQQGGEWDLIWHIILADDTLCPLLRRDKIDVYYRGCRLFSLADNGVIRNHNEFNSSLVTYVIPKEISAEVFSNYLPYMKQSVDLWLGEETVSFYKREFSQMILRENNSQKAGNLSDYFIIDMEHKYGSAGETSDLIGLIMERGKRNSKDHVFRLALIKVNYLDRTFVGRSGIRFSIDDYVHLIDNPPALSELKQDMEEMFAQSKNLGLFPGLRIRYERISISDEKPELLFSLISKNADNDKNSEEEKGQNLKGIINDTLEQYADKLDDIYFAQPAEMGFGLYAYRKTRLRDFCDQLQ